MKIICFWYMLLMDSHAWAGDPTDCIIFGRNEIWKWIQFIQLPEKLQVVQCSRASRMGRKYQHMLYSKIPRDKGHLCCLCGNNWLDNWDFQCSCNQQNSFTSDCHCIWKARTTTTEILKSPELQCNERVNKGICVPPKTPQIYILFEFLVFHYHVQKTISQYYRFFNRCS